jgi:type VI secretion system secreted protein VgrG
MDLTGQILGSGGTVGTLDPGVYKFDSSAQLDGTLTLDAENLTSAVFIFQIGSTLTTASASSIDVIDGGNTNGNIAIYWEVGSSATLGTTTEFAGNILAEDSITLTTGATIVCGRALAQTGAVTMDTNTVSNNCDTYNASTGRTDFGSAGFSGVSPAEAIPEPGTIQLLGIGFIALMAASFRLARSDA